MSRYIGYFLAVLVLVLVVQVAVIAPKNVNQSHQIEPVTAASEDSADVAQIMRGIHSVGTTEARRDWELWADEAIAFNSRSLWKLKRVKVVLFAENGVEFTVTGAEGEIETDTKNLRVSGQVLTKSSNGYLFMTETVSYDAKGRTLVSPGEVEMIGPKDPSGARLSLKGEGLNANLNDALITVARSVRAQRAVPPNRTLVIRSDGAQVSGRQRLARFLGNVVMDMDDMRITGPEAEFEYDPKKELVKSISVRGGVKVSDTEKWATARNLNVQFEDDKYIFRGNPRVVQDTDELRGEEIIFLDGGRKVLVQRARAKVDERSLEKVNN